MIKCSLCPQTFDETDTLIEKRKERHVLGRHTKHSVISQRDGSKPMGNFILGKVTWSKV